jgi:hypothetical protein
MVLSKLICRHWGHPSVPWSPLVRGVYVMFWPMTLTSVLREQKAPSTCSVLQLFIESDLSITSAYAFHVNKPLGVYGRSLKLYSTVALGHMKCTCIMCCLWMVRWFSCRHHGIRKTQIDLRQDGSRLSSFRLLHNRYNPRHFLRILCL